MILVTFDTLAMSMVAKIVFGCITTTYNLSFEAILLVEYSIIVGELEENGEIHIFYSCQCDIQKVYFYHERTLSCHLDYVKRL